MKHPWATAMPVGRAPINARSCCNLKRLTAPLPPQRSGVATQIANAAGVAAIGAVFFAVEPNQSSRLALLAACALFALSILACAAFLTRLRRVTG